MADEKEMQSHSAARPEVTGLLVTTLVLATAAHAPLLWFHARDLWSRPHYQFFPFAIAGAIVLAVSRWPRTDALQVGHSRLSLLFWGISMLSFGLAFLLQSPWLCAVSILLALLALLYRVGGWTLCRRMLPAWGLLWLAVPLPLELDNRFIWSLQAWTSRAASAVLDRIGVFHSLAGNVIRVDGQQLLVEEACSGAHSFFALVPLTIFYVLWRRRPPVPAALLVVAAAGWAIVANVGRVVATTYLTTQVEIDVVSGWPHHLLGLVVSAVAVFGILSTDQLLMGIRHVTSLSAVLSSTIAEDVEPIPQHVKSHSPVVPPKLAKYAASMYGVLFAGQLLVLGPRLVQDAHALADRPLTVSVLGEEFLGPPPENWHRVDYRQEDRGESQDLARYSQTWRYRAGAHSAILSVDYPYSGIHDLMPCYRNQGWKLLQKEHLTQSGTGPCIVSSFTRPLGGRGFLVYQGFDSEGQPLATRRPMRANDSVIQRTMTRIKTNWWSLLGSPPRDLPGYRPPSYQVQLFLVADRSLTTAERRQVLTFYNQAVQRVSAQRTADPLR